MHSPAPRKGRDPCINIGWVLASGEAALLGRRWRLCQAGAAHEPVECPDSREGQQQHGLYLQSQQRGRSDSPPLDGSSSGHLSTRRTLTNWIAFTRGPLGLLEARALVLRGHSEGTGLFSLEKRWPQGRCKSRLTSEKAPSIKFSQQYLAGVWETTNKSKKLRQ